MAGDITGRQIVVFEAVQSIITSAPDATNIPEDPFGELRQPLDDPALRSLDNLSSTHPSDLFTLKKMTSLAIDTGLVEIVRWKPRLVCDFLSYY